MLKILKEWKWVLILAPVIIAIFFYLRVSHLTSLPVFADEAIYVRWSQIMRAEPTLRFLPLSDGKQPLFMWLTIPFFKIFADPLFAGRFVSVMAGLGTMVGIFVLSYLLFKSKKVSLVASLMYALSPFALFFDRMALADGLLSMFGIWTVIFGLLTAKYVRLDLAMITGFVLGGALLTKSPALFFVLLLPTTWIFVNWKEKLLPRLGKLILLAGVTYFIGYGLYNILRLGPNFNMISSRNMDYVYPISHILVNWKDPFLPYLDRCFEWLRMLAPVSVLLLAALGIFTNLKKYPRETLLLSVFFLVPILVQSEFAKVITARYIFFSLPYLIILAGSLLVGKNKIIRVIATLGFIIFLWQALRIDYLLLTDIEKAQLPRSERSGYLEEWTAGQGIKEVSELIIQEYNKDPKAKIVVGTEGFFGTLPDGLQMYLNNYRDITVIGVGVIMDKVHSSLLESKKFGNKTYLVVNNTRLVGDATKLGLKLVAAYPKAVAPDGSRQALMFYEVTSDAIYAKANLVKN